MIIAQCVHDITTSYGLGLSLFLAGLVGGATHCVGMCSPFVLAQTDASSAPTIQRLRSALLLPYHLGRMTTYVALAVLVNGTIGLVFVFSDLKSFIAAPMLFLAGLIFIVSAFPRLMTIFPWVTNIKISFLYKTITSLSARLMGNMTILKRYILGVLLGFMPCGLVISALLASATAPNMLQAAGAMVAFTLGTIPALIFVAFGGQEVKNKHPKIAQRLSQGAMTISGIWLFVLAGLIIL